MPTESIKILQTPNEPIGIKIADLGGRNFRLKFDRSEPSYLLPSGLGIVAVDVVRNAVHVQRTEVLYDDRTMLRDDVTAKLNQLEHEGRISAFEPVRQSDSVIEATVRIPRELFREDDYRDGLRDELEMLERDGFYISVVVLRAYDRSAE